MNTRYYTPYFPSNPYGTEAPAKALDAACAALEARLGGAWQVLAAKAAFEEAGGLHAHWRGLYPPALTRWAEASRDALDAAYLAEPPTQESIADINLLNTACIDVIATARYAYTHHEWLDVFTAHFGMSDYCDSRQEATDAGRHWLAIAAQACPIAAAEQEIRNRSHARQQLTLPRNRTTIASGRPAPGHQPRNARSTRMLLNLNDPDSIVAWWTVLPDRHDAYLAHKLQVSPEFAPAINEARRRIATRPELTHMLDDSIARRLEHEAAMASLNEGLSSLQRRHQELAMAA